MNIFILFTHFVHIIFTFLQASVHIIWWSLHIIYPSWEDPFTLFTHSARICSHYLFILQGSVHTIYSSCKDMFIICINLAIIYPSCKDIFICLLLLQGPVHFIYPSCEDLFTLITHFAMTFSQCLLILQATVHIFYLFCKDLFHIIYLSRKDLFTHLPI